MQQPLVALIAQVIRAGMELDSPGAVEQIEESRLAVAAAGRQPSGDPVGLLRLLAVGEALVRRADLVDRRSPFEGMRERIDAVRTDGVKLLAPLSE
jgi:hypothetical protein